MSIFRGNRPVQYEEAVLKELLEKAKAESVHQEQSPAQAAYHTAQDGVLQQ